MGLADRDYIRERASSVSPTGDRQKLVLAASVALPLIVGFVWLERPDLIAAIGLPGAEPTLAFPASGTVAYADGGPRSNAVGFTVRDRTGEALEKVVRFRTPESRVFVAELYLRPGGEGEVRLPPGIYRMHMMFGRTWRGPDVHFGSGAETFDMGTTAIGGDVGGMDIMPRSVGADSIQISGNRF